MQNKEKIKWRCRRGVLELDVILKQFMESHYDELDDQNQAVLNDLLDLSDPVLQKWLIYGEQPEDRFKHIVEIILR